jgi:hypothetical protein
MAGPTPEPVEPVVFTADEISVLDGAASNLFTLANEYPIEASTDMTGLFRVTPTSATDAMTQDVLLDPGNWKRWSVDAPAIESNTDSLVAGMEQTVVGVSTGVVEAGAHGWTFVHTPLNGSPTRLPFLATHATPPTDDVDGIQSFLKQFKATGGNFDIFEVLGDGDFCNIKVTVWTEQSLEYQIVDDLGNEIGTAKIISLTLRERLTYVTNTVDGDETYYAKPPEVRVALRKYRLKSMVDVPNSTIPLLDVVAWYWEEDDGVPRIAYRAAEETKDDYWDLHVHTVEKDDRDQETMLRTNPLKHFTDYIAKKYSIEESGAVHMDAHLYDVTFIPYTRLYISTGLDAVGNPVYPAASYVDFHTDVGVPDQIQVVYKTTDSDHWQARMGSLGKNTPPPESSKGPDPTYKFSEIQGVADAIAAVKDKLAANTVAQEAVMAMMRQYLEEYAADVSIRKPGLVVADMTNPTTMLYQQLFSVSQFDEIMVKMFQYHQMMWSPGVSSYNEMLEASRFDANIDFIMGLFGRVLRAGALRSVVSITHKPEQKVGQ